jgi:hypothetical protein
MRVNYDTWLEKPYQDDLDNATEVPRKVCVDHGEELAVMFDTDTGDGYCAECVEFAKKWEPDYYKTLKPVEQ